MSKFVTRGELPGAVSSALAGQSIVKNVGGQPPDSAGNVSLTKTKFSGMTIPIFKTLNGLDNLGSTLPATAFALGTGGGLISSSSGSTASGYRYLPRAVDDARYTRTDWLIDWDPSESSASITVGLGISGGTTQINIANSGGNVVVTLYNASGSTVTTSAALTGRQTFSLSIATGNGGLTESAHVLSSHSAFTQTNPFRQPTYQYQRMPVTRLDVAYFATNATSSRIVGWLHNSNSLDGDPAGTLLTQTCILHASGTPYISGTAPNVENESIIVLPPRSLLSTPLKALLFFHGRTDVYSGAINDTNGDNGYTSEAMLAQGYAYIAQTGGQSNTNREADWWGNPTGLSRMKQLYDVYAANVTNVGKLYLMGWSMGGVCALNWYRQYPGTVACIEMATPVTDLEDSAPTYGVQINATLKASCNAAYQCYWISQVASNLNNDPASDNGTNWRRASQPGALPDVGFRCYQVTTTSAAVSTANQQIAVASSANIPIGSYVYFRGSLQQRRVIQRATGAPNTLTFDAPATCLNGEPVCIVPTLPDGTPDPTAVDFQWASNRTAAWSSGTTYALGVVPVLENTAHPELDIKPWNPMRCPEVYNVPIHIGVAGDGTPTGNDGILANAMMFAFRDAVNAIYPGTVTMYIGSGSHVSGGQTPADTLAFFNSN